VSFLRLQQEFATLMKAPELKITYSVRETKNYLSVQVRIKDGIRKATRPKAVSIKFTDPSVWNESKERFHPSTPESAFNLFLKECKKTIQRTYKQWIDSKYDFELSDLLRSLSDENYDKKPLIPEPIPELISEPVSTKPLESKDLESNETVKEPLMMIDAYREYLKQTALEKKWASSTKQGHFCRFKNFQEFLKNTDNQEITIYQFTRKYIKQYQSWLLRQEHKSNTYINTHLNALEKIFQHLIDNELLENNPVRDISNLDKNKSERTKHIKEQTQLIVAKIKEYEKFSRLPKKEQLKIRKKEQEQTEEEGKILTRSQCKASWIFLFLVRTGMSYVDYKRFAKNPSAFMILIRGKKFIYLQRQKTKTEFFIPVAYELEQLLSKFPNPPTYFRSTYVNKHLKKVGEKVGLNFDLWCKHGRTTCGMWILEDMGYDYMTIQKVLGHKDMATTQRFYANLGVDGFFERIGDIFEKSEAQKTWSFLFEED